jgi:SSS family solute:Na+ symporter
VSIPVIVLLVYGLALMGICWFGYRRGKMTEEDYYLAGRGQGVVVTTLTIMATFFSSAALLGIPGLIYKDGLGFFPFALNLPLSGAAIYLLGSRISRIGRRRGYVTPGDMVADYYGGSSAIRLLVALIGFLYVLPYIVMQIKAGGYLAQRMFPDAGTLHFLGTSYSMFDVGISVLSLITMLYVLVGGMRSVAWSDVLQGVLLLTGMLLAGIATVCAMGGIGSFFRQVSDLPPEALTIPGPSGKWTPWKLLTICLFASLATMIQPGQWMRYYAARSTNTLRKSAVIFSTVLPFCFLFGVMLVGIGGRVLYPPAVTDAGIMPHEMVGSKTSEVDQVVIVMVQEHLPALLGPLGAVVVSIILVAILAASMSTADSNLHALSAVLTRDVYDRFIRPEASEQERAWVGRSVIVVVTLLALWLVKVGASNPTFKPLELIATLSFVAMAFSCQLLPATLDMLFIGKSSRAGAVAGMSSGIFIVLLFTPFSALFGEAMAASIDGLTGTLKNLFDIGFCGFVVNASVMVVVSLFSKPVDAERVEAFRRDMQG